MTWESVAKGVERLGIESYIRVIQDRIRGMGATVERHDNHMGESWRALYVIESLGIGLMITRTLGMDDHRWAMAWHLLERGIVFRLKEGK